MGAMVVDMIEFLSQQDFFWWCGQFGIVLEVVGAFYLVFHAVKTGRFFESRAVNLDSETPEALQNCIVGQRRVETWSFLLLGIGLLLQFIGGFG